MKIYLKQFNVKLRLFKLIALIFLSVFIGSCSSLGLVIQSGGHGTPPPPPSLPPSHHPSYQSLGVEPGHLPPPGSCKVWQPNKPAGQQAPPASCDKVMRAAKAGEWVLFRNKLEPEILTVRKIYGLHPLEFEETQYVINKN